MTLTGLLSQANCECAFLPRVYGRHCPRETGLASLIFEFPPSVNASHCQARASSPSNFNVFFIPTVKIVWSIPWEAISHGTSWAATPHGTSWEATSHGTSWEDSFLIYLWTLEMSLRRDLNSGSSDYQSDPLTIQLQGRHTHSSVKLLLKFLMGQRHSHGNLEIFHGKLETSHGELLRLPMGNVCGPWEMAFPWEENHIPQGKDLFLWEIE